MTLKTTDAECAVYWYECLKAGWTPTGREMAAYMGAKSRSSGCAMIRKLRTAGMISGRRGR